MKIKINAYSSARTACGFSGKDADVMSGSSVNDVLAQLCKDHEELITMQDRLLFAVNEEYCDLDRILNEDDVLSIFPPVSGG